MAVSLKDWGANLAALSKMHGDCMASDDAEPSVDHEAARKLYRDGLALFGDPVATSTAHDSAWKYEHSLAAILRERDEV